LFTRYGVHGLKVFGRLSTVERVLHKVKALRAYLDKIGTGEVNDENFIDIGAGITGCNGVNCYHYEIYQKARENAARKPAGGT
jgi:hypothetical protein